MRCHRSCEVGNLPSPPSAISGLGCLFYRPAGGGHSRFVWLQNLISWGDIAGALFGLAFGLWLLLSAARVVLDPSRVEEKTAFNWLLRKGIAAARYYPLGSKVINVRSMAWGYLLMGVIVTIPMAIAFAGMFWSAITGILE